MWEAGRSCQGQMRGESARDVSLRWDYLSARSCQRKSDRDPSSVGETLEREADRRVFYLADQLVYCVRSSWTRGGIIKLLPPPIQETPG